MNRLLIISNRLPVKISKEKDQLRIDRSVGGLATGVSSVHESQESLWIGWPGYGVQEMPRGERGPVFELLTKERCLPVFLSSYEISQYYGGFCNNIVWPLFHYFSQYAKYDQNYWNSYRRVNQKFCDAIIKVSEPDDIFWIHDYHLMLLPKMIRKRLPDAKIGYFLHIPFPSYEIFRLLPWRSEVLAGILGADLVGFHTYNYVRHFLSSVRRILGYEHSLSEIQTGERLVKVDLFPMGIDYNRFFNAASSKAVLKEVERIHRRMGSQRIILSSDRLDYTKGIPLRLEAFDAFLNRRKNYRGKVTMVLVTVPSRGTVTKYQELKKKIDELVGRINGKYGTTDWIPVHYFSRYLPFHKLVAWYSAADVGLVTPLRDGMNLMAKEFVASKVDGIGTLILSEMAGASQELGEAIIVNPNNQEEIINSIDSALSLPIEEQQKANRTMQRRLKRYDVNRWVTDFLNTLEDARLAQQANAQNVLTTDMQKDLITSYKDSKRRLILLDYDGTLVPFVDNPEKAVPKAEVMEILKAISENSLNEVVIISGRDRNTLLNWFKTLDVGLIAEHGVWIKERSGETRKLEQLSNEWKKEILPLLELFSDRTPGSFIEEKPYSLVWHYRKTEPILGTLRANELKDDLVYLTSNLGLAVFEGKKVIEIKNAIINKGRAAEIWLRKKRWDFILAIGDDKTDEDLFEALPTTAYSIKVGIGSSKAHFNLFSQNEVLPLLRKCTESFEALV